MAKELVTFRIESETGDALRFIKERDGLLISEQIRQAVEAWVAAKKATNRELFHAFDDFEWTLTGTSNRGGSLANIRLPESFGNALGGRRLGTLNEPEIELLQRLARAAHRDPDAIRTYKHLWWRKAANEMRQKGTR